MGKICKLEGCGGWMVIKFAQHHNDYFNFLNCSKEELEDLIGLDIYNGCPCCNVVNQPVILGYVQYPIKEERLYKHMYLGFYAEYGDEELIIGDYEEEKGYEYFYREDLIAKKIDVLYQCENIKCRRMFIVHYKTGRYTQNYFDPIIERTSPYALIEIKESENISNISEKYHDIYKQANQAELMGLTDICGMGYRKALEFLIKDYVIFMNKDNLDFDKEKFLKKFLGNVIREDLNNHRVKELAERAVWLGNDETHYQRKWVEKDVTDLKGIIDIVVYEVEMELAYRKTIEDMPSGR